MKTILEKNKVLLPRTTINSKRQSGYNLIEVMIAAMILSTAILGIAGLQMIGMKGTQQSLMKQQAMGVVQNLIERMRANAAGVRAQNYTLLDSNTLDCNTVLPNCSTVDCNPAQIALSDQLNLVCGYGAAPAATGGVKISNATDNATLVNGTLAIACNDVAPAMGCAQGDVTITVGWVERAIGEETVLNDSLSIETRIAAP